ncbi:MAG TPA: FecR domain-containing protein, partial [Candidatus Methylomirabilis sp.]|nr:FecR domain-containing protein [Candidatus Methylomirabilis sp.]
MKKWAIVIVVLLVLLGAGGWWFWSLAAVPGEAAPNITLKIDRPPVTVRGPGATVFEEATSGMTLTSGWTVKTGEGGQATLTLFRQAESRLDQNSEVTISDATQSADDPTKTVVTLDLGIGRIWSRVLRLFDLDSRYSVKTSSVVATVRGTAFD